MTVRLVTLLALGSLSAPLASRAATATPRPNIILILADDRGWAEVGCYGNTFNETPNIDRLASQCVRFTQFYGGPVCSPTEPSALSFDLPQ